MDNDRAASLREGVRIAYSGAAQEPGRQHPFPVGRRFAESVGYPAQLLDALPASCSEAFSGVSNVAIWAEIWPGSVVLDLGCGAGLDALIAGRRTGAGGQVIGVDFSRQMLDRARSAAASLGLSHVNFREAAAEDLPLADQSVDVALVNGIFNLNPARGAIFSELSRVLRPGGTAFVAELILKEPLPEAQQVSTDSWFA